MGLNGKQLDTEVWVYEEQEASYDALKRCCSHVFLIVMCYVRVDRYVREEPAVKLYEEIDVITDWCNCR